MSPEERASQGWMQMQRENTRLRDALIRLRDMTQEQESALKEEIALLEEESEELDVLKAEHDASNNFAVVIAKLNDSAESSRLELQKMQEIHDKVFDMGDDVKNIELEIGRAHV